jgi:asparagine synthase (glutamine-hydrolysing)
MCGILGWLGANAPGVAERFEAALDLLAHRGPDDSGIWSDGSGILLGHRRLAIIDLSSAGHQPMQDPASGAVIVFNGEIYNHVELGEDLKRLGHHLIGHSDTEVLLHALIEWGPAALPRLNGMWAFALWLPGRRQLLLARDRFGVKPLYYCRGKEGFAFASEPKSLLSLFPEHRAIDESTLLDFLGNNLLYARGTSFYRGVDVIPPAHFALYDQNSGSLELTRYWDYPQETGRQLTGDEALEEFSSLFADAVRLRLRSDVPVGITLSGGLDSTGILAAAASAGGSVPKCFTSVYSDNAQGEFAWAELASRAVNANLIPVAAPQEDWLETLRTISWHMDAPGYSPAVYPLWHLMKRARAERIPVLLEGQGADEALAGYPQYAAVEMLAYLQGRFGRRDVRGISGRLSALQRTFTLRWAFAWVLRELSPAMLRLHRRRVGFESLMCEGVVLQSPPIVTVAMQADPVGKRLLQDHSRDILPGLLHYGDAISMAHGIETRNPFLDYRLVEWLFGMPPALRFRDNETKWVLREYLRSHGQERIGNRPDKKGYPTPVGQWMADLGHELEYLLCDTPSPLHAWCDPQRIRRLIAQNRAGEMTANHHLYKLLSTQLWIQECIQKGAVA